MVEVALRGLLSPDYFGRTLTLHTILYYTNHRILRYLPKPIMRLTFQVLILLIITCYGGGFACMPAYLADHSGIRQLSHYHGRILTAWG